MSMIQFISYFFIHQSFNYLIILSRNFL